MDEGFPSLTYRTTTGIALASFDWTSPSGSHSVEVLLKDFPHDAVRVVTDLNLFLGPCVLTDTEVLCTKSRLNRSHLCGGRSERPRLSSRNFNGRRGAF